jgi:hypothetical protein
MRSLGRDDKPRSLPFPTFPGFTVTSDGFDGAVNLSKTAKDPTLVENKKSQRISTKSSAATAPSRTLDVCMKCTHINILVEEPVFP